MITTLSEDDLVALGSRQRATYLGLQAGYTLGIAAADGAALADILPDGYLAETATLKNEVEAAFKDKALADAEAKDATLDQNRVQFPICA